MSAHDTRERHLPEGHREPRRFLGRSPRKTTRQVLDAIQGVFLVRDAVSETEMRRKVVAIDRQRYYALRRHLVCLGAISVDGKPLEWRPTQRLYDLVVEDLYVDLEFRSLKSNTHPGQVQIECPQCGVLKRAFPTVQEAKKWFYRDHVVNGAGHV